MFSQEVKVNGKYASGTIKRDNKFNSTSLYSLHSNLNFGSKNQTIWTAGNLREIAEELKAIATEIDGLNIRGE